MVRHTADGSYRAFGGDHASAIDSLSGVTVPAARNTSTPGYGKAGVQSGHPFAKAPGSKTLKPIPPSFGMRSRSAAPDTDMHALGAAILDAAFAAARRMTAPRTARKPDGKQVNMSPVRPPRTIRKRQRGRNRARADGARSRPCRDWRGSIRRTAD